MNIPQQRKLTEALQAEAVRIAAVVHTELLREGTTEDEVNQIQWTGGLQVFGQSVWHLFKTPGSWDGLTYYRLSSRGEIRSREPEDMINNQPHDPEWGTGGQDDGTGDASFPGLDLQG